MSLPFIPVLPSSSFRIEDLPTIYAFMQAHSFATLVTGGESLMATHLPVLLHGHYRCQSPHTLPQDYVTTPTPEGDGFSDYAGANALR